MNDHYFSSFALFKWYCDSIYQVSLRRCLYECGPRLFFFFFSFFLLLFQKFYCLPHSCHSTANRTIWVFVFSFYFFFFFIFFFSSLIITQLYNHTLSFITATPWLCNWIFNIIHGFDAKKHVHFVIAFLKNYQHFDKIRNWNRMQTM